MDVVLPLQRVQWFVYPELSIEDARHIFVAPYPVVAACVRGRGHSTLLHSEQVPVICASFVSRYCRERGSLRWFPDLTICTFRICQPRFG
jgi:hypothetical protein